MATARELLKEGLWRKLGLGEDINVLDLPGTKPNLPPGWDAPNPMAWGHPFIGPGSGPRVTPAVGTNGSDIPDANSAASEAALHRKGSPTDIETNSAALTDQNYNTYHPSPYVADDNPENYHKYMGYSGATRDGVPNISGAGSPLPQPTPSDPGASPIVASIMNSIPGASLPKQQFAFGPGSEGKFFPPTASSFIPALAPSSVSIGGLNPPDTSLNLSTPDGMATINPQATPPPPPSVNTGGFTVGGTTPTPPGSQSATDAAAAADKQRQATTAKPTTGVPKSSSYKEAILKKMAFTFKDYAGGDNPGVVTGTRGDIGGPTGDAVEMPRTPWQFGNQATPSGGLNVIQQGAPSSFAPPAPLPTKSTTGSSLAIDNIMNPPAQTPNLTTDAGNGSLAAGRIQAPSSDITRNINPVSPIAPPSSYTGNTNPSSLPTQTPSTITPPSTPTMKSPAAHGGASMANVTSTKPYSSKRASLNPTQRFAVGFIKGAMGRGLTDVEAIKLLKESTLTSDPTMLPEHPNYLDTQHPVFTNPLSNMPGVNPPKSLIKGVGASQTKPQTQPPQQQSVPSAQQPVQFDPAKATVGGNDFQELAQERASTINTSPIPGGNAIFMNQLQTMPLLQKQQLLGYLQSQQLA